MSNSGTKLYTYIKQNIKYLLLIKYHYKYHLLKIAPLGTKIKVNLRNGLKYILRAKTFDKIILKKIWLCKEYDKFGVKVEEGDTVIEIGAHIGIFSVYAATLSKTGKIYAFEPFPENFTMLQENKKLNNKTNLFIYNLGVAKAKGKRILNADDNNTGGNSLFFNSHFKNSVEIETIALNDFCNQNKIGTIDFLKIDCEGAEFEILESAPDILDKVKKIVLECHPFENNTASNIVKLLERKGFEVYRSTHQNVIQMIYAKKTSH